MDALDSSASMVPGFLRTMLTDWHIDIYCMSD